MENENVICWIKERKYRRRHIMGKAKTISIYRNILRLTIKSRKWRNQRSYSKYLGGQKASFMVPD